MHTSRLFLCARCRRQVIICRRCDRGQRYCSVSCGEISRKIQLKLAGARYQQSSEGRLDHADRQRAYRKRAMSALQKVTHQGSFVDSGSRKSLIERQASRFTKENTYERMACHDPFGLASSASAGHRFFGRRHLQAPISHPMSTPEKSDDFVGSDGDVERDGYQRCDFCQQRCTPYFRTHFLRKAMASRKPVGSLPMVSHQPQKKAHEGGGAFRRRISFAR